MDTLTLKALKDDAAFYIGDLEKVREQWLEDSKIAYQFDHYLNGAPAFPIRVKLMLKSDEGIVTTVTLNLCVPMNCLGLNSSALVHLILRSLVEIFTDQLVGILYFENQSIKELDKPEFKHFKSLPICQKNINLLNVTAYLRGTDGYAQFDSLYAVELENLHKAESLKSFTELFTERYYVSEVKSRAEELFTQPMVDFFAVKTEQEKNRMIELFDQFRDTLSAQVNASLTGKINFVFTEEVEA